MSYYQDGYNKGHEAGLEGERDITDSYFFDLLSAINSKDQDEWEDGYRNGYKAGEEEREENK